MLNKIHLSLCLVKIVIIVEIRGQSVVEDNDWNITDWWTHNIDIGHKSSDLKFESAPDKSSNLVRGRGRSDLWTSATDRYESFDYEPESDKKSSVPRSSAQSIKNIILEHFTRVRSHLADRNAFKKVKRSLKKYFVDLGMTTAAQSFWPSEMRKSSSKDKAHNLIAIWPGTKRGTPSDQIIIIGAHYDTVRSSPGVDDNGSGSAAVVEMARIIAQNNCKLDKTLIFVLFDMEEDGLKGSKHFVKDYLIPIEVNKNRAKVVGAIIMDMILEHDMTRNSQSLGVIASALPDWAAKVKQNGYRGDFAAVWARKGVDTNLYNKLEKNWQNKDKYKLMIMAPPLPQTGNQLDNDLNTLHRYSTFTRSDHASFWYPAQRYMTFPAVLITDLGPWRRHMRDKYHRSGDDTRRLTDANLAFVKNTVDSVVHTIFDLSKGLCLK